MAQTQRRIVIEHWGYQAIEFDDGRIEIKDHPEFTVARMTQNTIKVFCDGEFVAEYENELISREERAWVQVNKDRI